MRINYDIDKLKTDLIGKVINWITVIDVYKDNNNRTVCKYICKCGNIKVVPIKVINSKKIISCGCYRHSKEYSDSLKEFYANNKEVIATRTLKYKEWVASNKDKIIEQGIEHSNYLLSHKELLEQYSSKMTLLNKTLNADRSRDIRISSISSIIENNGYLLNIINNEDLKDLLSGKLTSVDRIRVKCPICNLYSYHNVRDIFNISEKLFKKTRLCKSCFNSMTTSIYENEISDFISTFYKERPISNNRDIISPLELDLYYPDKKIAVEFNGDYWHSNIFKEKDYHYNKFILCRSIGITLVSIFESEWNSNKDSIKSYMYNLFHEKNDNFSLFNNSIMNNNYPSLDCAVDEHNYIPYSYMFKKYTVFTCGFSKIIN